MALSVMNIEEQISMIPLNEQIALMAYLANAIKKNSAKLHEKRTEKHSDCAISLV